MAALFVEVEGYITEDRGENVTDLIKFVDQTAILDVVITVLKESCMENE